MIYLFRIDTEDEAHCHKECPQIRDTGSVGIEFCRLFDRPCNNYVRNDECRWATQRKYMEGSYDSHI